MRIDKTAGPGENDGMYGFAARRVTMVAFCAAAAAVVGGPLAMFCRGESAESLTAGLRASLARQSINKLLVVVREAGENATPKATPAEIEALSEQIREACRDLGIKTVTLAGDAGDANGNLARTPDPAAWQDELKKERAGGVVAVTWAPEKGNGSTFAIRVSLLDERKVRWTRRASLTRPTPAARTAMKQTGQTTNGAGTGNASQSAGGVAGASQWGSASQAMGMGSFGGTGSSFGGVGSAIGPVSSVQGAAGTQTGPSAAPATDLNKKIFEFASQRLGQQVGDGQCFTLAVDAIDYAGAKQEVGNDFGQETALDKLTPGDILQFWSVTLRSPSSQWQLGDPGHTAIVGEVRGLVVAVYHQNINGVPRVRKDTLDLGSLVSGQIIGYRAEPVTAGSGTNR